MTRLIGLAGLAQSGKNSTARRLIMMHRFDDEAMFAGPLKAAAREIFGLSHDEVMGNNYDRESPHPSWGYSVRHMLQKLGTECVRNTFGQDHWVKLMRLRLSTGDLRASTVVITDVRFDNEVEMIHDLGGKMLGVVRMSGNIIPSVYHVSEEMAMYRLDEVCDKLVYASNLPDLYREVDKAMEVLFDEAAV